LGLIASWLSTNLVFSSQTAGSVPVQSIISVLQLTLVDQASSHPGKLMICAIRSLESLLSELGSESSKELFSDLVAPLIGSLTSLLPFTIIQNGQNDQITANPAYNEADLLHYIESLISIAEDSVALFYSHLNQVFHSLMNLIEIFSSQRQLLTHRSSSELEFKTIHHNLIEFVVTLATSAPKKMRKLRHPVTKARGYFATRFLSYCCVMMCDEVRDDPHWLTSTHLETDNDGDGEDVHELSSEVAETSIDRVTQSLGWKATYAVMSSQIANLIHHSVALIPNESSQISCASHQLSLKNDWKSIYCGLILLGNYMEVTATITDPKQLDQHQNQVISLLTECGPQRHVYEEHVSYDFYQHVRVLNACYYAMTHLFQMHGHSLSRFQAEKCFHLMMPCISLAATQSHPIIEEVNQQPPLASNRLPVYCRSPRFQRQLLLCLLKFIEKVSEASNLITGHLEIILTTVFSILQDRSGVLIVQEMCVGIVTSLIEYHTSHRLVAMYGQIMPILKEFLSTIPVHSHLSTSKYSSFGHSNAITLWGQTLECCARLGEATAVNIFYADAKMMVGLLTENPMFNIANEIEDGELLKYLLKTWVRIA
jgi:hypothetical protein